VIVEAPYVQECQASGCTVNGYWHVC